MFVEKKAISIVIYPHSLYEVNLVRYNPYSSEQGKEASDEIYEQIQRFYWDQNVKCNIIKRVGVDVHASCGTFYK